MIQAELKKGVGFYRLSRGLLVFVLLVFFGFFSNANRAVALDNVALGKNVYQSSTPEFIPGGYPASNAVDGAYDNFTHTDANLNEWWKIDLNNVYTIKEIKIYKRSGWGNRPTNYKIQIANDLAFTSDVVDIITASENSEYITYDTDDFGVINARYLRIYNTGAEYQNLAEVEIYVDSNSAPTSPISTLQYKSDGTTEIANQGNTAETSVKLKASATDANNPEVLNLFFETALHDGVFTSPAVPTTGTSCASGTEWDSCASKIWYVTSGSDDYSSTPYTGTTSVAELGNDGYKWQVKACDDGGACSAWVEYNATTPNFTVNTTASWETGYGYRRPITIDHTKVSGTDDLTSFPVLISITNADLKNTDNGGKVENDNGYDIVFTDSDGTTLLDYEVENYTNTSGTLIAWVRIPTLKFDEDTDIYIYYGNNGVGSSQENIEGTWNSGYKMVQHLKDFDSSNTTDSTSNNNDGTKKGAGEPAEFANGKIGKAQHNDGTNDYITAGTNNIQQSQVSVSAWVMMDGLETSSGNYQGIIDGTTYTDGDLLGYDEGSNRFDFEVWCGGGWKIAYSNVDAVAGDWYHLAGVYDGSKILLYVNGVLQTAQPACTAGIGWGTASNKIGRYSTSSSYVFDGKIDEVREYGDALSQDWIKTEYNNQNAPDTFSTLSAEEIGNSTPASPTSTLQYKSDGITEIANQGITTETNVKLKASATDNDNPETMNLFFEVADNGDSFTSPATPTTGTSCISGTEWDSCASKIWYVTSGSGDYTATPYTGTTSVAGLGNDGYKWQVKACDDSGDCSAWVAYNATVPNFTVDDSMPDIVAVDAGASNVDRISLTSATWFKYSDTGSDDQISFSWIDPASVSDDTFYYELNSDSLNTITGDESTTTDPFVDDITISEGTNYFHVRPKNGAGTWGTERKFTIEYDKSAPNNVSIVSVSADSSSQLTANADTAVDAESGLNPSPYWFSEATGGAGSSSSVAWQAGTAFVDDGLSPNVQYSYKVKARDTLENESAYSAISSKYTLANVPNNLTGAADSQTQITLTWEANSNSAGTEYYAENITAGTNSGWAAALTWASSGLTCGTSYSFQVKARNGDLAETAAVTLLSATTSACTVVAEEDDDDDDDDDDYHHKKKTTASTVVQTVKKYLGLGEEETLETITEETTILEETPLAFQGNWNLLPAEDINRFALQNLPSNIQLAVGKFPELQSTFSSLGVEKASDMTKLVSANLILPGFSKITEIPQGDYITIAQLSPEEKERIPSETVFVRMAGGLVDLNSYLKIDARGNLNQEISAIAGKPLQLLVKMEKPVSGVSGYVVFNSASTEETRNFSSASQNKLLSFFGNTAFAQNNNFSEKEKMLVLERFQYADPDGDGIYEADINAPLAGGKYKIVTNINYADIKLASKDIEVITVVDPEGYIYEKIGEGEMRIPNAVASLFWLDPADGQYKLWPADKFMQKNPQTTDKKGTYSFLVPEGTYFLRAEAPGYIAYESEKFEVREGNGVHQNIELKKKYGWFSFENWEHIVLIIVTSALIVVTILLIYNFYQDKLRARIIKRR